VVQGVNIVFTILPWPHVVRVSRREIQRKYYNSTTQLANVTVLKSLQTLCHIKVWIVECQYPM